MRRIFVLSAMLASAWAFADENASNVVAGQAIYSQTCVAGHGANGKGAIPGVADLTANDGPLSKSDAQLLKSMMEGFQSPGSSLAMPAKGGNPTLTEADLNAVLAYLQAEFGT